MLFSLSPQRRHWLDSDFLNVRTISVLPSVSTTSETSSGIDSVCVVFQCCGAVSLKRIVKLNAAGTLKLSAFNK